MPRELEPDFSHDQVYLGRRMGHGQQRLVFILGTEPWMDGPLDRTVRSRPRNREAGHGTPVNGPVEKVASDRAAMYPFLSCETKALYSGHHQGPPACVVLRGFGTRMEPAGPTAVLVEFDDSKVNGPVCCPGGWVLTISSKGTRIFVSVCAERRLTMFATLEKGSR